MMEDDNTIDYHLTEDEVAKRPKFLKVLCILSFIGIGITVIAYLYTIIIFLNVSSKILGTNDFSPEEQSSFFSINLVVGIFTTILSFVGVIKMWRLQKTGYYIYMSSVAIVIILRIFQSGEITINVSSITGISITILFAILYSLNFKHLK